MSGSNADNDRSAAKSSVSAWTPGWAKTLGMPVWVVGQTGMIIYVNDRAVELFDRDREACLNKPCHEVVGGLTHSGAPLCGPGCNVRQLAESGYDIDPVSMRVPSKRGPDRYAKVVVISASPPDGVGKVLVHCVVDQQKEHRIRKYLTTVLGRTTQPHGDVVNNEFHLTRREKEILELLVEDETLHGIAHRLCISYATVRNHVQHILSKLGVHSVLEAVAFYLLHDDESPPAPGND